MWGCSTLQRDQRAELRTLYKDKKYNKALVLLEKSELKKKKENKLLFIMEKARVLYSKGDYKQAALGFSEAIKRADALYTKSISKKITSLITNDNADNFYGASYERSMLYYQKALSHYQLYHSGFYLKREEVVKKIKDKNGKKKKVKETVEKEILLSDKEKRTELFAARASMLAWDSFFKELQRRNGYDSIYQQDLNAKIFAAHIHELVNDRSDRQIALDLYKESLKLLHMIGPSYKNFNKKFKKYTLVLQEQIVSKKNNVISDHRELTTHHDDLKKYIELRILELTSIIRKRSLNTTIKKLKITKEVALEFKLKKKSNITVLLEKGIIQQKEAKTFSYGLNAAMENVDPDTRALIKGIGVPIITYFALGPLGLGYVSNTGPNSYLYVRHGAGEALVETVGIEFELPVLKETKRADELELIITKIDNKKKEQTVLKEPLTLTAPLGDLALQSMQEQTSYLYKKIGVKIALKHIAAILAAYATYKAMSSMNGDGNGSDFIARAAAIAQYAASSKAIKASESADIRCWTTLPNNIYMSDFNLPVGEYILYTREKNTGNGKKKKKAKQKKLGKLTVTSDKKNIFTYKI